jgi:hypothetical protein
MTELKYLDERPMQFTVELLDETEENPNVYARFLEAEKRIQKDVGFYSLVRLPRGTKPFVGFKIYNSRNDINVKDSDKFIFYIARRETAGTFQQEILKTGLVKMVYLDEIPTYESA